MTYKEFGKGGEKGRKILRQRKAQRGDKINKKIQAKIAFKRRNIMKTSEKMNRVLIILDVIGIILCGYMAISERDWGWFCATLWANTALMAHISNKQKIMVRKEYNAKKKEWSEKTEKLNEKEVNNESNRTNDRRLG